MNSELSKILNELAVLLDIKGVEFKPRAYEKVAYIVESLAEEVGEIYKRGGIKALEEIPGVGRGIAEKIEEFIKTGKIHELEKLKAEFPVDINGLKKVEGLGPKTIKKIYQELGVKDLPSLKKAVEAGKLRQLEGLGEKSEQKILKSISFLEQFHGRFLIAAALPLSRRIVEKLRSLPEVKKAEFAGSIARMQETVGDLDILVISDKPSKVMDFFVEMLEVQDVIAKGDTKTSVRLKVGMDADLRVVPPESFGAALQYFTGDKYHNIAVREIAIKKGYKLNEYGLFKESGIKNHELRVAGETEEEIYKTLGMQWIPPELRTNHGEVQAAQTDKLPDLIGYGGLKGDLQVQTDWTDGEHSIRQMAEAAKKQGLEYICITDHTAALAMTGGNDEKRLLKQMAEIDKVQKEVSGIKILKGAEVDIHKDGTLDIDDETLEKLDVAGISVHSRFNMTEEDMTKRVVRAMENPNADILFHPTGRLVQKREAYKIDMAEIIKTAKKTETILEANAYPERLDLKDEYIRQALESGVKISIDSDAHSTSHFQFLEYGIGQARRGWAEAKDVINTRSWEEMLRLLK
ncbi:MAG: DNA polymerase/3'-5' exonuclease PolX [Candidatus Yanofskybacteria bacterium]|nr:DNA polymerase/3'-5' exonuclease PolX [Candidatus Yanofskybacteria bacterium]